jgi:hypothetical protein
MSAALPMRSVVAVTPVSLAPSVPAGQPLDAGAEDACALGARDAADEVTPVLCGGAATVAPGLPADVELVSAGPLEVAAVLGPLTGAAVSVGPRAVVVAAAALLLRVTSATPAAC